MLKDNTFEVSKEEALPFETLRPFLLKEGLINNLNRPL